MIFYIMIHKKSYFEEFLDFFQADEGHIGQNLLKNPLQAKTLITTPITKFSFFHSRSEFV
jgi:hypothetical protein